jgi:hypothetical protein
MPDEADNAKKKAARKERNRRSRFVWEPGDVRIVRRAEQDPPVEEEEPPPGDVREGVPERLHRFLWNPEDIRLLPARRREDDS